MWFLVPNEQYSGIVVRRFKWSCNGVCKSEMHMNNHSAGAGITNINSSLVICIIKTSQGELDVALRSPSCC
jgi:hypothetical protein